MISVNLNGTFLFARAAGKYMIDNGVKGNILMVSSMSGSIVNRPQKQAAYNAVINSVFPCHSLTDPSPTVQSRSNAPHEVHGS